MMRDSQKLAFVLIFCVALVAFSFPKASEYREFPVILEPSVESKPITLQELTKIASISLAPKAWLQEFITLGYVSKQSNLDLGSENSNTLIFYKTVFAQAGDSKPKLKANELHLTGFFVISPDADSLNQALLSFTKDGMFSKGIEILPVKTPVFAYRVITEEIQTTPKQLVFLVELLNPDLSIASEQVVVFWNKSAQNFVATNEFDPEKSL